MAAGGGGKIRGVVKWERKIEGEKRSFILYPLQGLLLLVLFISFPFYFSLLFPSPSSSPVSHPLSTSLLPYFPYPHSQTFPPLSLSLLPSFLVTFLLTLLYFLLFNPFTSVLRGLVFSLPSILFPASPSLSFLFFPCFFLLSCCSSSLSQIRICGL